MKMKMKMMMAGSLIVSFKGIFKNPLLLLEPASRIRYFHSDSASNRESSLFHHLRSMFENENITKLDDALKLFDEMTQRQPLPSVVRFTQLLQAVTKMTHYSCSIDLFKQMIAIGVPADVYTTTIVIKCYCQMSCTSEGFAIVAYGFKGGVVPNVITFSTLLNGLVLEDRILEAETLFKKLIKGKLCEPNVVMYNTMIKGLCKSGNNDTSIALLRLMDQRGCKPDVITYNTIIDSLCKDEMVDDALKFFNEMIFHKGILPDVVTYSSLIHGFCNLGRWDDASKMLREMEDGRISPNVNILVDAYTINIVTKWCCQMSCTTEGFAIVAYGFKRGVVPNVVTFSTLLNGLILEDRILEAETLFKKLIERKLCEPNVVMYNTMIKGLCKFGNNYTSIALLRLMDERGCKPNVTTYSTIIDSLCKDKMVDDALKLFNEMILHKGILPDVVTYSSLIQGLCKTGREDDASKMLREMEAKKISPDVITYSILVDAFCKKGKMKDAKDVINIMVERGKDPDVVTFSSFIDEFCLQGDMTKAKGIFDVMKSIGPGPDIFTYNSLLNGYCKNFKIEEAMDLFDELTEKGMKPDCVTYNILLHGLLNDGQHDTIEMLLEEMDGSTLSMLIRHISSRSSLDSSLLKLIDKLVPKEGKEAP